MSSIHEKNMYLAIEHPDGQILMQGPLTLKLAHALMFRFLKEPRIRTALTKADHPGQAMLSLVWNLIDSQNLKDASNLETS